MRNAPIAQAERFRDRRPGPFSSSTGDGNNGRFYVLCGRVELTVVVSDGTDAEQLGLPRWDHVSVSTEHRCPTWEEMDFIKNLFFRDDETVMQLHVPRRDWISNHPHCLHLWRPLDVEIPLPPSEFVGLKEWNLGAT